MQKKINLSAGTIMAIVLLLILIVLVRVFQNQLFYDPLLAFFKAEGKEELPSYDTTKLLGGLAFRYLLNSILSLGIIYLVFRDKAILKLCSILYIAFFMVLLTVFYIVITANNVDLLLLFYVRRFLIQPLFLILFLPAFYYQKKVRN
ncbi:exosortase F system-associated membrane protein [Flavobacterium litorale]|uniref:Exosortase F system-associated protein n=1 Tax=Flavobacterium litorale TaxID=2856519 RepID=A0ABX8V4X3_9FLAO|nr:exosortase F system-associated protein [Flavobacterium litorale]QYJ67178.1 exosortase F system-associated protein [Flavobacterium litorale]